MRALLVLLVLGAAVAVAAPASAAPRPVRLTWVGDMAFSSHKGLPHGGPAAALRPMRRALRGPGLTLGNLEGTLGRGGPSKCAGRQGGNCFAFQAPASFARGFRRAGFRLLNLANNHSRDYGETGLRQTLRALSRARIAHTGLRGELRVRRVDGTRVAFLGFAPYPWASNLLDIANARRRVRAARKRARIVVVLVHAGAEGVGALHVPRGPERAFGEHRGETRRFARAVVDAGADAVLGSGPHVLRGLECYRRRPIAYSLGNFAAFNTLSTSGVLALSGVLRLTLAPEGRLLGGRLVPVRLTRAGLPRRDRTDASIRLVRRLSKQDFGRRACRLGRHGVIGRLP
jgi:Bacterial capsule synthesis protein PGA_cap